MMHFCTLFNSYYLTRGLALYESLRLNCPSFHLYVVAFDDHSYYYLNNARLPGMTVISLHDFEDPELLKVKPSRSVAEYCWTCTSSVILYCIKKYNLPSCTYIDADMIFYHDPRVLIEEAANKSVLITEHRYSKQYNQAAKNGIYCVQFMYFKNTSEGMEVLNWWRDRCLEWCYARLEEGKFGDQKYLDDWPARFNCVHVLQHPGGGIAPWNVQQYSFQQKGNELVLRNKLNGSEYPVVFFHFHGLKFYTDKVSCTGSLYELDDSVKRVFYFPYIKQLCAIENKLKNEGISFNITGATGPAPVRSKVYVQILKEKISSIKKGAVSPFQLQQYSFKKHYHYYTLNHFQ